MQVDVSADGRLIRAAAKRLAAAGIDEPMREARLLNREAPDAATFDAFLTRRGKREPVAYILGRKEFWSLEFEVSPDVLIPRPDSETLIETALKLFKDKPPATILDLGTGSGCLLVSLLTEFRAARGIGIDISPGAIELAARNASRHGVGDRARFICADFAVQLAEPVDLFVSNPPYIAEDIIKTLQPEVSAFEPHLALAGGADGLESIRRLAALAPQRMTVQAVALIEIGFDQAQAAGAAFGAQGLQVTQVVKDLGGHDRVLVAKLPQATIC